MLTASWHFTDTTAWHANAKWLSQRHAKKKYQQRRRERIVHYAWYSRKSVKYRWWLPGKFCDITCACTAPACISSSHLIESVADCNILSRISSTVHAALSITRNHETKHFSAFNSVVNPHQVSPAQDAPTSIPRETETTRSIGGASNPNGSRQQPPRDCRRNRNSRPHARRTTHVPRKYKTANHRE